MKAPFGAKYNSTHMNSIPIEHTPYKIDIADVKAQENPTSHISSPSNDPNMFSLSPIEEDSLSYFIHKTLNYVFAQLCVTAAVTVAMYVNKTEINNYIASNAIVVWIPIILSFATLIGMFCYSSKETIPIKKTLFCLFTLSCSVMVGISAIQYAPNVVLNATVALMAMVGFINMYAHQCANNGKDLSFMGPSLFGVLVIIITLGILNIFIHSSLLQLIISFISVIVFSLMLVYDLNRLYNGREQDDFIRPDPLISAINIYLDIINIFLAILQIMGGGND